jgi:hypothetical protein
MVRSLAIPSIFLEGIFAAGVIKRTGAASDTITTVVSG